MRNEIMKNITGMNTEEPRMYKVAVPITNRYNNRSMDCEATLKELQRAGAHRVWLCVSRGIEKEEELADQLVLLKKHRAFFEANGLEVGVWMSSLGHGGGLIQDDNEGLARASLYQKMVGLSGETCEDSFCPASEPYATDFSTWIARVAGTGVKMIMLDDDYRLSLRPNGHACCCDMHLAEYCRRVGEELTRDQISDLVYKGGPSKYRDAWMDMQKDMLTGLGRRIRAEVDKVDPTVRVGVCAVMSTWDVDGLNALELTRSMAGNTRPFLRTISAPYWAALQGARARMSYIIEGTRMQRAWCEGEDVELFTEGDVYPRPRFMCPASNVEMFDMALRADGGFDGILKYMLDYTSSINYEKGYVDAMVRHAREYEWIDAHMPGGVCEGVDVLNRYDKLRNAVIPADMSVGELGDVFFHYPAMRFACDNSLPLTYNSHNVHILSGENGRYITEEQMNDGAVMDIMAAQILFGRGVDIGIVEMGESTTLDGTEHYLSENEYVATQGINRYRPLVLHEKAEVLSTIQGKPACFRYENEKGQRFVVYNFDFWYALHSWGVSRSYCRQRQLIDAVQWAGRKTLAAVCPGHPDLYIMCKRTEEGLVVGLWNFSIDYVCQPEIITDKAYESLTVFNGEGALCENKVRLSTEIAPYAFTGLILR